MQTCVTCHKFSECAVWLNVQYAMSTSYHVNQMLQIWDKDGTHSIKFEKLSKKQI